MTINLGVKALLSWVNSFKLCDRVLTADDFQDGAVLQKVICMLKKEANPNFTLSTEDRFNLIADFVERDCRFSAAKGTSLSWDNIRDGVNITVEVAKVLLLLVYYDMMSERCTLNMLDCDVEVELANLTGSYVMECEGCVYLSDRLDAYLAKRHLPVSREIFERSASTSTSNMSTISSLSDDESPVFHRKPKITFMDMQTVASSSTSKSPLQDIMNTPKFQMRKMQRQMIKERDYRDGLERELASKLALIVQRESTINQLQYRLDKLKGEQSDHEQLIRDQINYLEAQNEKLQMRLGEMLKQNKDLKSSSALMERKVDDLTEENGQLSSQVRAVCSQLTIFEAEVGRLMEIQVSAQTEWQSQTSQLQTQLNQTTSQKEFLTEQIQILQGKISCLEDEINRVTEEEVGENMGPVMEREMLETEINDLKSELERTLCSLKSAEVEMESKTHQLAEYQQEIMRQGELLKQQRSHAEEMIQAKDNALGKLQKEKAEQRADLQQHIQDLKAQLEQTLQQKAQQMAELQQHISACEREVDALKEIQTAKEALLLQAEEKVGLLEKKISAADCLAASQDSQINSLEDKVGALTVEAQKSMEEMQAKETTLAKLLLEKSNEQEVLQIEIRSLTTQVADLDSSLKRAEQEIILKRDLMSKNQQESIQQREILQQQVATSKEKAQELKAEMQVTNEQLVTLQKSSSRQSACSEQEIKGLRGQVESLNDSLRQSEENVQAQQVRLNQHEKESFHQKELLQQQVSASEDALRSLRDDILAREEKMNNLKSQSSETSDLLHQEIQDLSNQVVALRFSLQSTEEHLQSTKNQFAEQHLQNAQHTEALEAQVKASQKEVEGKYGEIAQLETEMSSQSRLLHEEIHTLNQQLHQSSNSLQQHLSASEDQLRNAREDIHSKEEQIVLLRADAVERSLLLSQEIQSLKERADTLESLLAKAAEDLLSREDLLAQREAEVLKLQDSQSEKQNLLLQTEERIHCLREELSAVTALVAEKDLNLVVLKEKIATQSDLLEKTKEDQGVSEKVMSEMKVESSRQTVRYQKEVRDLRDEVETISQKLSAKEQELQKSSRQMDDLQLQLTSVNSELDRHREAHSADVQLREGAEELRAASLRETEALVQENGALVTRMQQVESDQKTLERQLGDMIHEKERLAETNRSLERENAASRKLEAALQRELETLRSELEKRASESAGARETEALKRELTAKSEAAGHYKAQMEKAVSHYNGKKQLLQESQQDVAELKRCLEAKEREVDAVADENNLLQRNLEKAQANEKRLSGVVATLKAQLTLVDRNLQSRRAAEVCYPDIPDNVQTQAQRAESSGSLDQSSLEDSLNHTRKLSAPDESSTPLVRSSERLAAKRRGLQAESLETLYFTPINTRRMNRTSTENKMELDSARRNPSSSVKRRRTTQVINITLTKKTPGGNEDDDTFYSLASARSHPNLSARHNAQPVSMELFGTPARAAGAAGDQLVGLPGYRRSTVHSQTTSTFCVGAENEPEGGPEDWMRIAELQARNKACLPHLKSSYPVESEARRGNVIIFTDEEVRTGDPTDTIRRASMMPGQLQDSLVSHRHSIMTGQPSAAAGTLAQRLSLMPGQLPSRSTSSSQLRSPKGTKRSSSTLSVHQTSPEKKVRASCFPRPLTPKNKNVSGGPSSTKLRPALSPADRRQSMMFAIDNTPKKSNYLKKGLNKLRTSSAAVAPSGESTAAAGRAGKAGSFKSPQVKAKGRRKSPQSTSKKAGMSPGLTASARKMMKRIKV